MALFNFSTIPKIRPQPFKVWISSSNTHMQWCTHTHTHTGCPSRSFATPVHWLFRVENNTKQQSFTIYILQVSHHSTGMTIKLNLHCMYWTHHTRILCLTERKGSVFSISPNCVCWLLQFYWTAVLCTAYLEHNVDAKERPTGNKRKHGSISARHSVRFLPRIL